MGKMERQQKYRDAGDKVYEANLAEDPNWIISKERRAAVTMSSSEAKEKRSAFNAPNTKMKNWKPNRANNPARRPNLESD